ncbi:MAG: hypothetical protein O3A00_10935, partial [Planctomycetota bacterium]|nr:hypothetical protein [Planctomycetota bacterium]
MQAGGVSGASITGVSGSGTTYTVSVNTGSGSGTLGLNLVDDDTIVDVATNALGGTGTGNGNFTGDVYTIDRTLPSVTSINRTDGNPTNAASVDFTVVFSESVSLVDATDFALAVSGLTGTSITNVTGSGTTYTVTVGTGSGDGTLGLNLVDDDSIIDTSSNPLGGIGTGNGNFTGQVYTVDKTLPTVSSIVRANVNPTNAASVDFTVTFSESVTGVGTADFVIDQSGVTGASVTGISGSGTTYTLTVGTGSNDGTLSIDFDADADGGATDGVGNVSTADFTTGEAYTIDKTLPTVASIVRAGANPTNAGSVDFTVTFSESVTGVGTGDFVVDQSGVTGASVTGIS